MFKRWLVEKIILSADPKLLAINIKRYESDTADKVGYRLYKKGAKCMLLNFVSDYDFVERVMNEFDKLYEN